MAFLQKGNPLVKEFRVLTVLTMVGTACGSTSIHAQTNGPAATQVASQKQDPGQLVDFHLNSKDRMFVGDILVPTTWKGVSFRFINTTTGQVLGTYDNVLENLTASKPTFKIYNHKSDMFSDGDAEDAKHDPAVTEQKVVFYKDNDNPKILHFSSIFDDVGVMQVQVIQNGKQVAYGQTKLTADAGFSSLIDTTDKAISGPTPPSTPAKGH